MVSSEAVEYTEKGFCIATLLSKEGYEVVKSYALTQLSLLFKGYAGLEVNADRIAQYHMWGEDSKVPHAQMLQAKNRHWNPPQFIQETLVNRHLVSFLSEIGCKKFEIWDEGLGWLGFRLIRPGFRDGYPFSRKNWGPAKNVISLWIPLIGFAPSLSLNLIPESHKKEFPKFLPANSSFASNEYRLGVVPMKEECVRPLVQPGEAIIFHPDTIHAEQVEEGLETRFSIEFRILPL